MQLWQYIVLFLSVIIGGLVAFYVKKLDKGILQLVLSFTGAYILGITAIHLLPTVFANHAINAGLFILIGFFIQLLLEQLSVGVEHGHIHAAHHANASFAIQVMLGLCIHAFIEGMPMGSYPDIGGHHHHGHDHSIDGDLYHYFYGVIMHKAPAAFALVLLLLLSKYKNSIIVICLLIFASMSPLGALIGESFQFGLEMQQRLLAVVVGSFLHISTTIIFEVDSDTHHRISMKKMAAVVLGMGLALLTMH